ncbi:glycosyltransferase family 2 protein [Mobilitalea sibirica]|uniref:Glycosyltransferase family 2 protein n=1 Tax=Mobilitalea sibirica TaxID=1462919 RepID=A0A8J7L1W3_9FIRM|nr:glycosyltransferase family 2 protein [Mobilitalea sibirica]MBH1939368.1 glycosyltransferase family 2 protein [Mobilitalea sibirica]
MDISVVIPTHNRANLIEKAIKSVQNQTYPVREIIIVSDGSVDGTDEIVNQLMNEDSRIQLISYHPGRNGNYARNCGIKAATGEYIAFLDDDDEWFPEKIQKQVEIIKIDQEVGLVCTGIENIYIEENSSYLYIPAESGDLSQKILIRNYVGSTSTVLVKSELLKLCGFFDEQLYARQDYDLWIRICQVTKVGVVKEPCVKYYNYKQNNQISQQTDKYLKATEQINTKYKDLILKLSKKQIKMRNNIMALLLSKKEMRNGQYDAARKFAWVAMKEKITLQSFLYFLLTFFPFKVALFFRRWA